MSTRSHLLEETSLRGVHVQMIFISGTLAGGLLMHTEPGGPESPNEDWWRKRCGEHIEEIYDLLTWYTGIGTRLNGRVREPNAMEHELRVLLDEVQGFLGTERVPSQWTPEDVATARRLKSEAWRLQRLFMHIPGPLEEQKRGEVAPVEPKENGSMGKQAMAMAVLVQHPDWTHTAIAREVGVSRGQLYRYPLFRKAAAALKMSRTERQRSDGGRTLGKCESCGEHVQQWRCNQCQTDVVDRCRSCHHELQHG